MPVPARLGLLALLLTGCPTTDGTAPPEDTAPDEPELPVCVDEGLPQLGACVAWVGEPTIAEEGYRSTLTAAGVVTEIGSGAPPVECEPHDEGAAALGPYGAAEAADTPWFRLEDAAGVAYTLALAVPGFVPPAVGEDVSLTYDWRTGWDTTHGSAVLSDAAGVVASLSTELQVDALVLPTGFTASVGEGVCQAETECSESTDWQVELSDGTTTAALAPGEEASVGGYRLTAGELTEITSWKSCSDGPSSMFELAVARE